MILKSPKHYTEDFHIGQMDFFGYRLGLFSDEYAIKNNRPLNKRATQILNKQSKVLGNAFIVDDKRSLTLDDLNIIMEINSIIPDYKWCIPSEATHLGNDKIKQKQQEIYDRVKKYIVTDPNQ